MVLSGLLLKVPYSIIWMFLKYTNQLHPFVFYCADIQDYRAFENVIPYLKIKPEIVAKNRKIREELKGIGVESKTWPVFPENVVMVRHALHKFPIKKIFKIGMRHGPYHFKQFIKKERYNSFDIFLFTSAEEVKSAREFGINTGKNGGYPKIESFRSKRVQQKANALQEKYNNGKIKLLFSATYDESGMSAIERWYDKLAGLSENYQIFVTLHPFMSPRYEKVLSQNKDIVLVKQNDLMAYMLLSDILISDTSSIIGEYCSLDKPIITFKVKKASRLCDEIVEIISNISIQIDDVSELNSAIKKYLKNPSLKKEERQKCNNILFYDLKKNHGKKTAKIINKHL